MGIHYFKITGRSKPVQWHYEVVKAYLEGKYEGNLMRLLGIDPSLEAEKMIWLNNCSLDGFAEELLADVDAQMAMCRKKIVKLYQQHAFYSLREEIEFGIVDDELICMKGGNQIYE
jgi:collagenase-like PrtC family protease